MKRWFNTFYLPLRSALNRKEQQALAWVSLFSVLPSLLDLFGLYLVYRFARILSASVLGFDNHHHLSPDTIRFTGILVGYYLCKNILSLMIQRYQINQSYDVARSLTERKFEESIYAPTLDFLKKGMSRLYHELSTMAHVFSESILLPLITIVVESTVIVLLSLALIAFNPLVFACIFFILGPVLWWFLKFKHRYAKEHSKVLNSEMPSVHALIDETNRGFREIKLQNKEERYRGQFGEKVKRLSESRKRNYTVNYLFPVRLFETMAVLGIALVMAISYLTQLMTFSVVGLISVYITAAFRMLPSVNRIASALSALSSQAYVMDYLPARTIEHPARSTSKEAFTFLDIKHLSFRYEVDSPSIELNRFQLRKGDFVGLAGDSGSGKTTLLMLLSGLIPTDFLDATLNGKPVESSSLRSMVYLLPQEPFIIEGSIQDNIVLKDTRVDDQRLEKAILDAHLSEWLETLPDGIHTLLSARGENVSGGQKQRISIARALYFGAEVLLIDEPTNSLDETARKTIMDTFSSLKGRYTLVLVSHQQDELERCDRVLSI